MDILKLLLCIAVIIALYYICFSFPIKVSRDFSDTYHTSGISYVMSIIIAGLILATIYEHGSGAPFFVFLMLSIFSCIISSLLCAAKAMNVGASKSDGIMLAIAQILFTFGLLYIVLFIIEAASGKKRKTHK